MKAESKLGPDGSASNFKVDSQYSGGSVVDHPDNNQGCRHHPANFSAGNFANNEKRYATTPTEFWFYFPKLFWGPYNSGGLPVSSPDAAPLRASAAPSGPRDPTCEGT